MQAGEIGGGIEGESAGRGLEWGGFGGSVET